MEKLEHKTETDKEKAVRQITSAMLAMYGALPSFVDPIGLKAYIEKGVNEQYDVMTEKNAEKREPVWELDMSDYENVLSTEDYPPDLAFGKTKNGNWRVL